MLEIAQMQNTKFCRDPEEVFDSIKAQSLETETGFHYPIHESRKGRCQNISKVTKEF